MTKSVKIATIASSSILGAGGVAAAIAVPLTLNNNKVGASEVVENSSLMCDARADFGFDSKYGRHDEDADKEFWTKKAEKSYKVKMVLSDTLTQMGIVYGKHKETKDDRTDFGSFTIGKNGPSKANYDNLPTVIKNMPKDTSIPSDWTQPMPEMIYNAWQNGKGSKYSNNFWIWVGEMVKYFIYYKNANGIISQDESINGPAKVTYDVQKVGKTTPKDIYEKDPSGRQMPESMYNAWEVGKGSYFWFGNCPNRADEQEMPVSDETQVGGKLLYEFDNEQESNIWCAGCAFAYIIANYVGNISAEPTCADYTTNMNNKLIAMFSGKEFNQDLLAMWTEFKKDSASVNVLPYGIAPLDYIFNALSK